MQPTLTPVDDTLAAKLKQKKALKLVLFGALPAIVLVLIARLTVGGFGLFGFPIDMLVLFPGAIALIYVWVIRSLVVRDKEKGDPRIPSEGRLLYGAILTYLITALLYFVIGIVGELINPGSRESRGITLLLSVLLGIMPLIATLVLSIIAIAKQNKLNWRPYVAYLGILTVVIFGVCFLLLNQSLV